MADKSSIEWTDATWNPIVGCSVVSPGCTNCYAMAMAARIARMQAATLPAGAVSHYAGTTMASKAGAVWTGKLAVAPARIWAWPLRWLGAKRPVRGPDMPSLIFVNSMGDLFHESVPDGWIDKVFAVMALSQHSFQVLTKRSARMRAYLSNPAVVRRVYELACDMAVGMALDVTLIADPAHEAHAPPGRRVRLGVWPLANVWLGVSCEDQPRADERIPDLLATPAALRFVSAEPLLGPIDFEPWLPWGDDPWKEVNGTPWGCQGCDGDRGCACPNEKAVFVAEEGPPDDDGCPEWIHEERRTLDWIIGGGESGKNARPMHPDWVRAIRDQCAAAGVAFFFKQWGEYLPVGQELPGYGKVHGATAVRPGRMKLHYGGTRQQPPKHAFLGSGVEAASTEDGRLTFRVGKRAAGRLLDGVTHDAMPEARP